MLEPHIEVRVAAGAHERCDCPIRLRIPRSDIPAPINLVDAHGNYLALQPLSDDDTEFATIIPLVRANTVATYTVAPDAPPTPPDTPFQGDDHADATDHSYRDAVREGVELRDAKGSHIDIYAGGALLTSYVYGDVPARPYFFPLRAPGDVDVTRSYPMSETVTGESHDHPHHRSIWIAHGDVNGTDNWSEESGHGYTRHLSVDELFSGPIYGRFTTTSLWTTADNVPLLNQRLTVTAWRPGTSVRLIDVDVDLRADYGAITFGDTKEGGILAVRVAGALDVPRGGRIENCVGGIDEAETWGRAAHWCDYSGVVAGKRVGLAVMDHPLSFRHPTTWHVRNYGLMTANPFGYAAFTAGVKDGTVTVAPGQAVSFRYRIVLHTGNPHDGDIPGRFLDFACPPEVTVAANV